MKKNWTEGQINFLKENYKTFGDTELQLIFNSTFKIFTKKQIESKRKSLKLKRTETELEKIRMRNRSRGVWKNKGTNLSKSRKRKPLGSKYICNSKKYIYIKTEEGYELYHRYLWKLYNGNIPKGHVISFKPGADIHNFDIHDLQLLTRKELLQKTQSKIRQS